MNGAGPGSFAARRVTPAPFPGEARPAAVRPPFAIWTDPAPRPGWMNMAIDCALLERAEAGERWIRLYAWEPHCLSFGRHEPAMRRYDRERIEALGLRVVRRPTGGRAVWHARELTYAVAAPTEHLGSLRDAYREIHRMLREALITLGAPAELADARRPSGLDAGACFAGPAGGEVLVHGRKVIGSAQLRQGAALLQHGSVLLHDDQSTVAVVTRGVPPPDGSLPLTRALGRPIGWGEAAAAIAAAAAARWGGTTPSTPGSPALLDRAVDLAARFRSPTWTWTGADG